MSRPYYLIDLDKLEATAKVAKANADKLGVHLLMALKSFPLPAALRVIAPYVEGFTCSGLYESKLVGAAPRDAREIHVHAPAYTDDEFPEILAATSHVVFNSLSQLEKFGPAAKAAGKSVGLRINPLFSSADCLAYDPCCPDSRFGVTFEELGRACRSATAAIDGLHFHALCEGYADQFAAMVEKITEQIRDADTLVRELKWLNLGGGEVINQPEFASPRAIAAVQKLKAALTKGRGHSCPRIYIEPSEYLVRYSGELHSHVLDVIHREKDIAILDISASCHATDLLLFKMTPDVRLGRACRSATAAPRTTILGCVSCLAGDVLGEFTFPRPLEVGDEVIIEGMGCYSFAQLSWFNGIRHPDIILRSAAHGDQLIKHWSYDDYIREFA